MRLNARKHHAGGLGRYFKDLVSSSVVAVNAIAPVKAYVDFAATSADGDLALIGWVFDPEHRVQGFAMLHEGPSGLFKRQGHTAVPLEGGINGVQLARVSRLDVAQAMSKPESLQDDRHGFVLVIPRYRSGAKLALSIGDGRYATLSFIALENRSEIKSAMQRYWLHSGACLLSALQASLGNDHLLTQLAADLPDGGGAVEISSRFAACDQALVLNKRTLILNGWIAKTPDQIERIELIADEATVDITSKLTRYARPDLFAAYPWSEEEPLGFLCVLTDETVVASDITVKIVCRNGQSQSLQSTVENMDWPGLGTFISRHASMSTPLLDLMGKKNAMGDDAERLDTRISISMIRRDCFLARYPYMPVMVEQPATVIGAIDRSYRLGKDGLLIYGWKLMPKHQPKSVTLWNEEGEFIDISERFIPLLRHDVAQNLRSRFPQMDDWCGFVCLAPMPTRAGEVRALCFDFGDFGEVWQKVPVEKPDRDGVDLIKEILGMVPAADRMRHKLYDLFNGGLGTAIEAVNRARPPFNKDVEETQYGIPNENAEISVIVPLYGRFDFLRHQLAQFVDDADFGNVDLIYVVDDPSILNQTLELAANYHSLFKLPFRVAAYGENRGFAGANNIGVSLARGEYLVLLNSDVIPQHTGWISILRAALDTLPDAGAVGPLLNFYDGSVQHAGMRAKREALLPGFLLNIHPGKGQTWKGGTEPSEHALLTAACLMLRKDAYLEIGGFDEGYVIGDFEDSDLCMQLRKHGKRLWLVPESKLWHLERQSQNLEGVVGVRQLITLFNGWRYHKKIEQGEIPSPTEFEV